MHSVSAHSERHPSRWTLYSSCTSMLTKQANSLIRLLEDYATHRASSASGASGRSDWERPPSFIDFCAGHKPFDESLDSLPKAQCHKKAEPSSLHTATAAHGRKPLKSISWFGRHSSRIYPCSRLLQLTLKTYALYIGKHILAA